MKKPCLVVGFLLFLLYVAAPAEIGSPERGAAALNVSPDLFRHLGWRSIGPANMGGRVTDVEGVPGNPDIVYVGTASGGIWKTKNGGITWKPIFDEQQVSSIGDLALEPGNPDVIYAGTGESNLRNSISFGYGVYKSTDGGETWQHLGLQETRHISRIVINPRDTRIVFVGALGHAFGPNKERGVYMSTTGGETWEKVLYADENHGVSDMGINPKNPNLVYAALWNFERKPWTYSSGDRKGGVYKSSDGGRSWKRVTKGLPDLTGRIGIKVSVSNPEVVYAMVESKEGSLYRSEDRGETFSLVSSRGEIVDRGFYYADLRVDPTDENRVFALATSLFLSIDGGKNFSRISQSTHVDYHALWIDPENPSRIWQGQDGGIAVSYDRGKNWEQITNVPIGQFYQICADEAIPFYNVAGGLQDNSTWHGPGRTREPLGILNKEWRMISGGDGFHVVVHPGNPDFFLSERQGGKYVMRTDMKTREQQIVSPDQQLPAGEPPWSRKYRFNWNAPIIVSPHARDTVYMGGNVVFKSNDFGSTWDIVSPDLTTNDPEKQKDAGGPIDIENSSAEFFCTIISLAESPVRPGVLWAGTDDGNLQVSPDGGLNWENVVKSVPALPPLSSVSHIEPSRLSAETAYVSFDRHMLDDRRPFVFKTPDFGRHWINVTGNLPTDAYVWVVREDPKNANVVYAGTERGIYVSLSGGTDWIRFHLNNLPTVPVNDILIHPRENDLIIGTHGRSIWILDDLAFLQELDPEVLARSFHAFSIRPALRHTVKETVYDIGDKEFRGSNPPYGAIVTYYLKEDLSQDSSLKLEILSAEGNVVREIRSLPKSSGIHRVAWDLRDKGYRPRRDTDRTSGSQAPPGLYKSRLVLGDEVQERTLEIRLDPSLNIPESALMEQRKLVLRIQESLSSLNAALRALDGLKAQVKTFQATLKDRGTAPPQDLIVTMVNHLRRIEFLQGLLTPAEEAQRYSGEPGLSYRMSRLLTDVDQVNAAPTRAQAEFFDKLKQDFVTAVAEVNKYLSQDAGEMNETLSKHRLPGFVIPEPIKISD